MMAISDLEAQINYAYGSGFFETVFYELEYVNGKTNLVIKIKDSDPGSLSAGIHYDNDYNGSILVNLAVRNVLGHRSKFFLDLSLGKYLLLRGLYLIETGSKPGFGFDFDFYTFDFKTYYGSDDSGNLGDVKNEWEFDNFSASAFVPVTIKNRFAFKLGFQYQYFRFKQTVPIDTILTAYDTYSSFGELYFSYGGDTRDENYFPTRGSLTKFKAFYKIPLSKDWNSELFENSLVLYLKYKQNIRLAKRFTLQPGLFLGATFVKEGVITDAIVEENDNTVPVPVQSRFWVGGLNQYNYVDTFEPFTGLKFIQSQGVYAAIGQLNLQYNFYKKLYATGMFDIGANQPTLDQFISNDLMYGYGLKLSYKSFIGPVEVSMMGSSMLKGPSFFLNIGYSL